MEQQLPIEKLLRSESETKAFIHPLRMRMLELPGKKKLAITQLATLMGTIPANLTRHIRKLEGAGLAFLVEKRETGRNLEKYYRAQAMSLTPCLSLLLLLLTNMSINRKLISVH